MGTPSSPGSAGDTLDGWLAEETKGADNTARESHRFAMNSYGAGYDAGYVAALEAVRRKMDELGWPEAPQ